MAGHRTGAPRLTAARPLTDSSSRCSPGPETAPPCGERPHHHHPERPPQTSDTPMTTADTSGSAGARISPNAHRPAVGSVSGYRLSSPPGHPRGCRRTWTGARPSPLRGASRAAHPDPRRDYACPTDEDNPLIELIPRNQVRRGLLPLGQSGEVRVVRLPAEGEGLTQVSNCGDEWLFRMLPGRLSKPGLSVSARRCRCGRGD